MGGDHEVKTPTSFFSELDFVHFYTVVIRLCIIMLCLILSHLLVSVTTT